MSSFVLDTGMLVGIIRDAPYAEYAKQRFDLLAHTTTAIVSIVSIGEIWSLAYQFGWGPRKREKLQRLLDTLPVANIEKVTIQRYAEIDAYSQGKLPNQPLPSGVSARNMGKNDLWIAATASLAEATLLTIDKDFEHLDGTFCSVIYIDQSSTPTDL